VVFRETSVRRAGFEQTAKLPSQDGGLRGEVFVEEAGVGVVQESDRPETSSGNYERSGHHERGRGTQSARIAAGSRKFTKMVRRCERPLRKQRGRPYSDGARGTRRHQAVGFGAHHQVGRGSAKVNPRLEEFAGLAAARVDERSRIRAWAAAAENAEQFRVKACLSVGWKPRRA